MDKLQTSLPAARNRVDGTHTGNGRLWSVIRDLRDCQPAYGLKARHLATLEALTSFLKGQDHQMVFASNRSILERLNHVSPRTLQRAIADLVAAGLILRRDSPNRKRFAIRRHGGHEALAYGLDLSPLLEQAARIAFLAEDFRAENIRCKRLKLRLRQLVNQIEEFLHSDPLLDELRRGVRRKLRSDQLEALLTSAESLILEIPKEPGRTITIRAGDEPSSKMAPSDSHSDVHYHKSEKEEKEKKATEQKPCQAKGLEETALNGEFLLNQVVYACPEIVSYSIKPPGSWQELRDSASNIATWLGVPQQILVQLQHRFGIDLMAVTIFCLLQSAGSIRKPGAYLASLVSGARATNFDPIKWLGRLSAIASRSPRWTQVH